MTANYLRIDSATAAYETEPVAPPESLPGLRHNLQCSTADAAGCSFMIGIGETYIAPLVLALGLGEIPAGLVVTIPILIGAMLQMLAPAAVARWRSCKRVVVTAVRIQGFALLTLPVIALVGGRVGWMVFVSATVYWAAGLAGGPAWNVWMEDLVPSRLRARYFAARVRVCQASMLAGLILGGVLLQVGAAYGRTEAAFALLFVLAAAARFISAAYLARQGETPGTGHDQRPLFADSRPLPVGGAGASLILYLLCMQMAVYVSGPYFTPYMRSILGLSYVEFMVLTAMGYVGKIIALPLCGRFAQQFGARRLLWVGGLGIIPLAGMWLATYWLPSRLLIPYLVVVQVGGGLTWAAYELAMFLLFFESISKQHRVGMLTLYNLGNSLAMVCGGLIGAGLLGTCGETQTCFLVLFVGSSLLRACTIPLLARVPDTRSLPSAERPAPVVVRPLPPIAESPLRPQVADVRASA